jgi:rod shape determining protein RodA
MTSLRGSRDSTTRVGRGAPGGVANPARPSGAYRGLAPLAPGRGGFSPGQAARRERSGMLRRLTRRAFNKKSPFRHFDWILLAGVLALSLIGTLLVWSSTSSSAGHGYLTRQLLVIALGLVVMVGVSFLSYRQIRVYAPVVYILSTIALLAVLVLPAHLTTVNGAHSWISLPGGFQQEPSEYAKLSVILISAILLSEVRQGDNRPRLRAIVIALAVAAVPIVLVLAQPDLGVVMLLVALMVGLIGLSGIRIYWLIGGLGAAALALTAVINLHLLKSYQASRLTSFLHPSADPQGQGYSANQSKIAIGSGGLFGQGLFHGQLVQGNFVPEQHTDFIFAVAGEELGFVGCAVIIVLLALVLFRALRIAAKADDQFGMLVASGVAIWFGVQAFINIGMTMGIMPVTGLPLPFVSYGGSAMFADMIAVGCLQAVYRHHTVFS